MKGSTMALLLLAVFAAPVNAAVLRGRTLRTAAGAELSSTMSMMQRAQAEDTRYFNSEFSSLEDQLSRLSVTVAPKTVENGAAPAKAKAKGQMASLNINPKSAADLAPALAMLTGLYEDGKAHIADLNKKEKEAKEKFEVTEKRHKDKLAGIEAEFANHTLSAEFRTNETKDEMRLWSYWSRCRERQHRQFHTGLKLQHATLSKVKKMMDMYQKTMSGNPEEIKQAKKDFTKMAPPEIVFLQARQEVVRFCQASLAELHSAREELKTNVVDLPVIY